MKEFFEALIQRRSLFIVIVGVALLILGTVEKFAIGTTTLQLTGILEKWIVIIISTALIVFGTYLAFKETNRDTLSVQDKDGPTKMVRFRSVLKLIHVDTSLCLHSHGLNYEHSGSSKQQQITAFEGSNEDDFWIIKGPHNFPDNYREGEIVRHGDIIRLEHVSTRKNLHSHRGFPSPVTGQQEVTGFGNDGIGDINDNWRVDIEGGGEWLEGVNVRLIHQQTNTALHSHRGHNLPQYGHNQQEVTCFRERNKDDWWRAAIYKATNTKAT